MREAVVGGELDALGVDHDEPQLLGRAAHQEAVDDRVEAHGLALSGGARHEQVRELGEVHHEVVAGGVLAEQERHLELPGAVLLPELAVDDLAEVHGGWLEVRHLDADGVLARDGGLDAQRGGLQRHLEVAGEGGDLLHARAEVEREGVLRHDGAGHVVGELRVDVEHLERVDEPLGHRGDVLPGSAVLLLNRIQEVGGGDDVRSLVLLFLLGAGRVRRESRACRGRCRRGCGCRCRRGCGRGDRAHGGDGGGDGGPGGGRFARGQEVGGTRCGLVAFGLQPGAEGGALFFFLALLLLARLARGLAFGAAFLAGEAFRLAFGLFGGAGRGFLVGDALLLGEACGLGGLLGGTRGFGGCVLVVYFTHFVAVTVRRPVRQAGDRGDDVARSGDDEQGEDGEADHQHARAERRQVVGKAARHHEVAHGAAGVGFDVQVAQQGGDERRGAGHLQQAGEREEEQGDAQRAAAGVEGLPQHKPESHVHADDRHGPDGESDQLVAHVGEPIADRADEVGRGGRRRDAEIRDVVPVVGAQRE